MSVLEKPAYVAAKTTLIHEVTAYYKQYGFLTEGDPWTGEIRRLSTALQVEVREPDLEELLEEIEDRAACEDDRAELDWRVGDPEYGPAKSDYLAKCDDVISEKCRLILSPRFVPAPIPALRWAA